MKPLLLVSALVILMSTLVWSQSALPPLAGQHLAQSDLKSVARLSATYGKLPLSFEASNGQTDPHVKFLSRGSGYTLFLTCDEAVFSLTANKPEKFTSASSRKLSATTAIHAKRGVLRMKLVKANKAAKITGADQLPGMNNYFIGNDPQKWHTNIATYAKVKYESIYSGIDLVYYGNQRQLEYDFVVAPGADPRTIQFDVHGAKHIRTDRSGDLIIAMTEGEVRWRKPVVYQEIDGKRQEVDGNYLVKQGQRVGFKLASYNSKRPLIIDPVLGYSTYLGGDLADQAVGIVVDSSGSAYVVGYTTSTDFPTMNPLQPSYGGASDGFVTKLNSTGSALIYSTYFGGSAYDDAARIALDNSGNAYLIGTTYSTNFPVTAGAFQTKCGGCSGGYSDAYVTKLNSTGSALIYSTYLGGSGYDDGGGIAVDSAGAAYVTGLTSSSDFPTMNPLQSSNGGDFDTFVLKLNPTGSALVYSTYLGGSGEDDGSGIAVDSAGNAYVAGLTQSTNFPIVNGFQPNYGGGNDAFVSEVDPTGSALVYSTYLGGSGEDEGSGIAIDSAGNAYITGFTYSTDFPVTPGAFQTKNEGGYDAFVTVINAAHSALVYSTFLGGSGADEGYGIAVDTSGSAYVTGFTTSTDFPTMNPLQPTNGGGSGDAFVTKITPNGSTLVYSTYLGGNGDDNGAGVAVDSLGNSYIIGHSSSINFPTTPGAFQTVCQDQFGNCNSGGDGFVAKLASSPFVLVSPPSLNFGDQSVGTASAPQNLTLTNSGNAALNITGIAITGDYSQTNNCPVGGSLPAGSNCIISVTFTPTEEGTRHGTVTITDNAPNSPQSVPLTGVGLQPAVILSPASMHFGNQTLNIASSPQVSTLTNTGNITLTVSSILSTSSEFSEVDNCPASVPPNGSCQIKVIFTPTNTGTQTAAVNITDNAPGSPQQLKLAGVGVLPAVTFSPAALTFPTQLIFTRSQVQKLTLTNTGLGILKITAGKITGQFAETNDCKPTIATGGSCTVNVVFKPIGKGILSGAISIVDNAPGSPQQVALSGTGTFVQLKPTSVNFGHQPVNTTSLPKYITFTNQGTAAVDITSILSTGTNSGDFTVTNNCGSSVAVGASCFIKVTFTPSVQGKRTADVSITDDGGGSPQTVPLIGVGTP